MTRTPSSSPSDDPPHEPDRTAAPPPAPREARSRVRARVEGEPESDAVLDAQASGPPVGPHRRPRRVARLRVTLLAPDHPSTHRAAADLAARLVASGRDVDLVTWPVRPAAVPRAGRGEVSAARRVRISRVGHDVSAWWRSGRAASGRDAVLVVLAPGLPALPPLVALTALRRACGEGARPALLALAVDHVAPGPAARRVWNLVDAVALLGDDPWADAVEPLERFLGAEAPSASLSSRLAHEVAGVLAGGAHAAPSPGGEAPPAPTSPGGEGRPGAGCLGGPRAGLVGVGVRWMDRLVRVVAAPLVGRSPRGEGRPTARDETARRAEAASPRGEASPVRPAAPGLGGLAADRPLDGLGAGRRGGDGAAAQQTGRPRPVAEPRRRGGRPGGGANPPGSPRGEGLSGSGALRRRPPVPPSAVVTDLGALRADPDADPAAPRWRRVLSRRRGPGDWAADGVLAALPLVERGVGRTVVVDQSGPRSPLRRRWAATGGEVVEGVRAGAGARLAALDVGPGQVHLLAQVHPADVPPADVDALLADAAVLLAPRGVVVLTVVLTREPGAVFDAPQVRALVAGASARGLDLLGDLDDDLLHGVRGGPPGDGPFGLLRLAFTRR